jgi:DNA-binding CsgD family transcriptional regulator
MAAQLATPQIQELEQIQGELHRRQREIVESQYLRRADTVDQAREAVHRLGELGSPAGILARAASEIGLGSTFDRVLISEVRAQTLVPLRIWDRDDNAAAQLTLTILRGKPPLRLAYPLMEHEAINSREPQRVEVGSAGVRTPALLSSTLNWSSYVVAPVLVEGSAIGMLHADAHASDRVLDLLDMEILAIASTGLGDVFERAVLRETLQRHRQELESAASWINGRVRKIGAGDGSPNSMPSVPSADRDAVGLLTPREREILALMARGQTNAGIASALVVREGTVKYHVKNVLRKLNARSRADAVAKYMRATGELPG